MINICDLEFSYEPDDFRLRVDALSIAKGERVAVLGTSGSGKTTLLQLVASILRPNEGRIETCGVDVASLDEAAGRDFRISNIGLVFQEFELLDYLDVLDNVLLAYRINRSLRLTEDVRSAATALLNRVGLGPMLHRRPNQLSHGQRQRIAVCRALVTNPQLLLADEPTANLDAENKNLVLDMLDAHVQRANATLVVVTHDQQMAQRFDRSIDVSSLATRQEVAAND